MNPVRHIDQQDNIWLDNLNLCPE